MSKVTNQKPIEAQELQIGQDSDIEIPSAGEARLLELGTTATPEGPVALEKMSWAQRMEFDLEKVVVRVAESTNPNDPNPVEVGVNGKMVVLWRGYDYIVKRCYLERLARAKTTRYKQEKVTDSQGAQGYLYHRATAHTFPYAVLRDENPLGRDWHRKVCEEL